MADYIQLQFDAVTEDQSAMILALLSEEGFEGFEEEAGSLKAYLPADAWTEEKKQLVQSIIAFPYTQSLIGETNWNALWESNFSPVTVRDFVTVRADFHPPAAGVCHEIVIMPKMSFGTGHHATTFMMLEAMAAIPFAGKNVLDFGTGTGVLAILAEKLGGSSITAVDNDPWSIENAAENARKNQCSRIRLSLADEIPAGSMFDIILANINRNVLLEHMERFKTQLLPGGTILLSGLLTADEEIMLQSIARTGLQVTGRTERANWLLLKVSA